MATECAIKFGDGIRVNAVAPGFFIADQNRALLTNEDGSYTVGNPDVTRRNLTHCMAGKRKFCHSKYPYAAIR